jgi:hypothetical protein
MFPCSGGGTLEKVKDQGKSPLMMISIRFSDPSGPYDAAIKL